MFIRTLFETMSILYSLSCVDFEMKQCEDVRIIYSCKGRTLYRRCENTNHTDVMIGSQTHTHAEKHVFTQIYTDTHTHTNPHTHTQTHTHTHTQTHTHTHTHEEAFTHRSFNTQQEFASRHLHTHTNTFTQRSFYKNYFSSSDPHHGNIYTDINISNIL